MKEPFAGNVRSAPACSPSNEHKMAAVTRSSVSQAAPAAPGSK